MNIRAEELKRNQKLMKLNEEWHQKHGADEPMPMRRVSPGKSPLVEIRRIRS